VEKTDRHIILSVQYSSKDLYNGFWGCWLRIHHQISKFKMADPIWRTKIHKVSKLDENRYIGVFEVTDYETIVIYKFVKFKIADPIFLC